MDAENKLNTYIITYTGKEFYPFAPNVDAIDIVDIAHSLSQKVRWNGHSVVPYSVGAHSIQAARRVRLKGAGKNLILAALLHDASEAYFADVPTPIKIHIPDIKSMEYDIQRGIEEAFGLADGIVDSDMVKKVDYECLLFEAQHILNKVPDRLSSPVIEAVSKTIDSPDYHKPVSPLEIQKMFLDMFYSL